MRVGAFNRQRGPRAIKVVGAGLLVVAIKWALLLTAGRWALEQGHPAWAFVVPALLVGTGLLVRRHRQTERAMAAPAGEVRPHG